MPRPIQATIHPEALRNNLARVRAAAPDARVWAVVKANAYGHGLERVFEAFGEVADGFALLDLADAGQLRAAGVAAPIVLLEGFFEPADLADSCSPWASRRRSIPRPSSPCWSGLRWTGPWTCCSRSTRA